MEKKSKKLEEKKADKPKDSGDKTNLLIKVLEDLDITDFLSDRDRGDTRANFGSKSSRNVNTDKPTNKAHREKKKAVGISASEVKTKNAEYALDSDDSSKKKHRVYKEDKKRHEDSKAKTALAVVKDVNKTKVNKARPHSEQQIKFRPDDRFNDTRRIEEKIKRLKEITKIDEEASRIDKFKNLHLPPGKDLRYLDTLERRKLLRQKYTVKLKSSNKNVASKDSFKNDDCELKNEASDIFHRENLNETPKNILQFIETAKLTKKSKEQTQGQRKPIIKTIKHSDHRVYKAVTFTDQKETTPLQIKMPNSKKSVETNTIKSKTKPIAPISDVSVQNIGKEKHTKKNSKQKRSLKRIRVTPSSPTLTSNQSNPQTEVAKWAPSSITQHTKPYYEAWVDTTLAAITKCSKKDRLLYDNQNIIKTFKRALELDSGAVSPSLVYEKINDEKYMGRITVNKSNKSWGRK